MNAQAFPASKDHSQSKTTVQRLSKNRWRRRECRMKRGVYAIAIAGLMTLALGAVVEAPAVAAPTQAVHTQVNVSLVNIRVCGFKVDSLVQGTDSFQLFTDAAGNVSV